MKNILLLTTGGTIASQAGQNGLGPALDAGEIAAYLADAPHDFRVTSESLLDMDSSNIQPEEWRLIARRVFDALDAYDGVVITHGTDTMAYTAAALSFMLPNLDKSVVLTGSQLPITNPLSDARTNLYTALEAVYRGITGVTVAFDRKIIAGTRAVKTSTMGFDAFESVNAEYMARVLADGTRIFKAATHQAAGPRQLRDELCGDVFLLKLLPGTRPEIFDAMLRLGYRGVVLEAFGAGGLHYLHRDLLEKLGALTAAGVAVVVCSQCLYERCDLSIYEVGRKILQRDVIPGRDMTTEAAATKLMWALGQTDSMAQVKAMFDTDYAGEFTL